jgi:hypothetical protein
MELSDQLHSLAGLAPGKKTHVPTENEIGCALEPVRALRKKERKEKLKSFASARNLTTISRLCSTLVIRYTDYRCPW